MYHFFMKNFFLILLCCILFCLLLLPGCTPVKKTLSPDFEPEGYVHAEGKDLVLDGEKILLQGVNAGGWLLTEDWMSPTSLYADLTTESGQYELEKAIAERYGEEKTNRLFDALKDSWWAEKDFSRIAGIGFNMIRLPFGWKDLSDENGALIENAFARIDWFVENCRKNKLFIVLDLHGAYGSQNGKHHSGDTSTGGDLFGNEKNENLTIKLWKEVAQRYKDNKWVAGYDLLNEPEGTPGGLTDKTQWDFYDRLYREIRSVDPDHLIFMEACWDADQMPNPKKYGWKNVAYEYHYYNWGSSGLSSTKSFLKSKEKLERKYNGLLGFNVPVFIGEFNFFDDLDSWEYGLDFFYEHDMSWAVWTYKGNVGGNWALYNGPDRAPDTVVTPETDYDKALALFQSMATETSFRENTALISVFKNYFAE